MKELYALSISFLMTQPCLREKTVLVKKGRFCNTLSDYNMKPLQSVNVVTGLLRKHLKLIFIHVFIL